VKLASLNQPRHAQDPKPRRAGRALKRKGTLAQSRKAEAVRNVALQQHRLQALAAAETVRLLHVYSGEHAVRMLFSRPEKLAVPILTTLAELKGGVAALASLLSHMSPVQAAGCAVIYHLSVSVDDACDLSFVSLRR
jgi:hypothetical protein